MYKEFIISKEFIIRKQFNGTLGSLIEEIIEAFVNEKIGRSKSGEFHNIRGIVTIMELGVFPFDVWLNIGINKKLDISLEEEDIKEVIDDFFRRIKYKNKDLNNDSNIKATYTLAYS